MIEAENNFLYKIRVAAYHFEYDKNPSSSFDPDLYPKSNVMTRLEEIGTALAHELCQACLAYEREKGMDKKYGLLEFENDHIFTDLAFQAFEKLKPLIFSEEITAGDIFG